MAVASAVVLAHPAQLQKINAVLILIANYPVQWAVLIKLGINLKIELIAWDCLLTQPAFAITVFVRKNHSLPPPARRFAGLRDIPVVNAVPMRSVRKE